MSYEWEQVEIMRRGGKNNTLKSKKERKKEHKRERIESQSCPTYIKLMHVYGTITMCPTPIDIACTIICSTNFVFLNCHWLNFIIFNHF